MRFPFRISGLLIAVILMLGVTLQAHHSVAVYWDEQKSSEITGIVKALKVVNPHASITIEVTNANGQKEEWLGVAGFATQMIRAGWTNETLAIGTKVKVEGAPPRQPGAKGILVRKITLPDGKVLTTGRID